MENFIVQLMNLPCKVKGFTSYDDAEDFYTIVLNSRLTHDQQAAAFNHEMKHITSGDYNKGNVQCISEMEYAAHHI